MTISPTSETEVEKPITKAGFVVIVGRSNVGKSTLMNALVGSKVAITSPKPQTTRLPIHGILTRDEGQIVFVDTPGMLKGAKDALSKALTESLKNALSDVDILMYVADPTRVIGDEEKSMLRMVEQIDKPKIMVINKMDDNNKPYLDFYRDLSDKFDHTFEVSAKESAHIKPLIDKLFEILPEGEQFYPAYQITNMANNVWVSELIREKLYLRLRQEVPYTIHVEVTAMEERENNVMYIAATIFTTEDRYKRMIIGQGGRGIREIGQSTRKELESVMGKKIYLDLQVETNPHWMLRFEI
jgi:GTP-binding protein Era